MIDHILKMERDIEAHLRTKFSNMLHPYVGTDIGLYYNGYVRSSTVVLPGVQYVTSPKIFSMDLDLSLDAFDRVNDPIDLENALKQYMTYYARAKRIEYAQTTPTVVDEADIVFRMQSSLDQLQVDLQRLSNIGQQVMQQIRILLPTITSNRIREYAVHVINQHSSDVLFYAAADLYTVKRVADIHRYIKVSVDSTRHLNQHIKMINDLEDRLKGALDEIDDVAKSEDGLRQIVGQINEMNKVFETAMRRRVRVCTAARELLELVYRNEQIGRDAQTMQDKCRADIHNMTQTVCNRAANMYFPSYVASIVLLNQTGGTGVPNELYKWYPREKGGFSLADVYAEWINDQTLEMIKNKYKDEAQKVVELLMSYITVALARVTRPYYEDQLLLTDRTHLISMLTQIRVLEVVTTKV